VQRRIGDESNSMIHVLTPGPPATDLNRDGQVTADDLNLFAPCASGPAVPFASGCDVTDFDFDGDVDQLDFAIFQRCYGGPDNSADPACAG